MDTKKLRQKILDLAIRGKLVPQDPNDEPASVLLERIRAEKERLIAEGKIKRSKRSKISSSESHYQQFIPPFEIPDSWEWVRLDEVGLWQSGATPSKSNPKYYGKGYPWLNTGDLNDGIIHNIPKGITEQAMQETSVKLNPRGSVLMAMYGATIGKLGILDIDATTNQACCACYKYWINNRYLFYFLLSWRSKFLEMGGGGAQPNISKEKIEYTYMPCPPLQEQDRIVKQVGALFEILLGIESHNTCLGVVIEKAKSKILDLAMQGKLVPQDPTDEPAADMLRRINPKAKIITDNPHYPQLPDNWVLTTIGSVCNYGDSDNVSVDGMDSADWVLELEDIEKDSGNIVAQKSKEDRIIKGVRHKFIKGNVLYSKLRTYLNKVLVAPADGYCTTELIPIKTYDCVIPEYLCAWLRSPFFLSYTAECCYGVKMPRLSTSDARKGIIPLPPTQEQRRIVQKLNKVSESLETLSNSID